MALPQSTGNPAARPFGLLHEPGRLPRCHRYTPQRARISAMVLPANTAKSGLALANPPSPMPDSGIDPHSCSPRKFKGDTALPEINVQQSFMFGDAGSYASPFNSRRNNALASLAARLVGGYRVA
ncbi:MAG: hypothetical protein JSR34_00265 [Proteobacteria bacterium]|nr:hypothetical protein [Pseudomonadota bacterium]